MKSAKQLASALISGKSEVLNGYAAGSSLIAISMVISAVPVSRLPQVPFLQLLLDNYVLLVLSSIAAGCMLLAKSTFILSAGRTYPLVLFSFIALVGSVASYVAGLFDGVLYSTAVQSSPFNPSVMLALSLLITSVFAISTAARQSFLRREPAATPSEQRV